jgi:hypothetical protein
MTPLHERPTPLTDKAQLRFDDGELAKWKGKDSIVPYLHARDLEQNSSNERI